MRPDSQLVASSPFSEMLLIDLATGSIYGIGIRFSIFSYLIYKAVITLIERLFQCIVITTFVL